MPALHPAPAPPPPAHDSPVALRLEPAACCLCGAHGGEPIGVGVDFEYGTSDDSFLAVRCRSCSLVFLDPRPTADELTRIYPDRYHAFDFSEPGFGLVHSARSRIEAQRLRRACSGLPPDARIVDVGCGDGFHLDVARRYGPRGWRLEGVDLDGRAVQRARQRGLVVHEGTVEDLDLEPGSYDMAWLIQTIEHVADPVALLASVRRLLRPGGRVLVVTDNTASLDHRLFKGRHWGGYHFPRHWYLFDPPSLRRLAATTGYDVESLRTMVSPVNWVYSVRNTLQDLGAPRRLVEQFSLSTPMSLAAFTVFDAVHTALGRGALLRAVLRRPR